MQGKTYLFVIAFRIISIGTVFPKQKLWGSGMVRESHPPAKKDRIG